MKTFISPTPFNVSEAGGVVKGDLGSVFKEETTEILRRDKQKRGRVSCSVSHAH